MSSTTVTSRETGLIRSVEALKAARTIIAVSLKMYFDPAQTLAWCGEVAAIAGSHDAVLSGRTQLVVLPSLPAMARVAELFEDLPVSLGAQDLHYEDRGPYTGAISGTDLRDIGCHFAEVGHVERRRLFHEDGRIVRLKVQAAWRNGLTPLLCVGESQRGTEDEAVDECIKQLEHALADAADPARQHPVLVAYEPTWAIGASAPASGQHVSQVAGRLKAWLEKHPTLAPARLLYGGSAGPGLLGRLGGSTDGLFLGRFAHDTVSLRAVLDETMQGS